MESEKTITLKNNDSLGTVQIADDVVAAIASIAATETEGVYAMEGGATKELIAKVNPSKLKKGVRVSVNGEDVRIDIAVILEYGYNIPATCTQVQSKIKTAIENMTGFNCNDVNVKIAGINMKKNR